MTAIEIKKAVQKLLNVTDDGIIGKKSRAAFDALAQTPPDSTWPPAVPVDDPNVHRGRASSFADPADVAAFRRCKERGGSDMDCFRVGDNGIGCWGQDVTEGTGNACAVPPDDIIAKWGTVDGGKDKQVEITANGTTITALVRYRMPWRKNITNGAVIDLNPDSCRALGLEPPVMISCEWKWV